MSLALFYQHYEPNRHLETTHLMYAMQNDPAWDEIFWIKQRRQQVCQYTVQLSCDRYLPDRRRASRCATDLALRCRIMLPQMQDEQESSSDGRMTALNRVSFEKHRAESIAASIRAATLQVRFWQQLSRDVPNIGRLHKLSAQIHLSITDAEKHFKELFKINDQSIVNLRAYAAFLFVRLPPSFWQVRGLAQPGCDATQRIHLLRHVLVQHAVTSELIADWAS